MYYVWYFVEYLANLYLVTIKMFINGNNVLYSREPAAN